MKNKLLFFGLFLLFGMLVSCEKDSLNAAKPEASEEAQQFDLRMPEEIDIQVDLDLYITPSQSPSTPDSSSFPNR